MNNSTVSGNTQKMTSTARTRKHRLNIIDSNCSRLEVTIGTDVVQKLDALASLKKEPRWHLVQQAIEAFAKANGV